MYRKTNQRTKRQTSVKSLVFKLLKIEILFVVFTKLKNTNKQYYEQLWNKWSLYVLPDVAADF